MRAGLVLASGVFLGLTGSMTDGRAQTNAPRQSNVQAGGSSSHTSEFDRFIGGIAGGIVFLTDPSKSRPQQALPPPDQTQTSRWWIPASAGIQAAIASLPGPGASGIPSLEIAAQGASELPEKGALSSRGETVLLQFYGDVPPAAIASYVKAQNLKVVERFPSIGAIEVRADVSAHMRPAVYGADRLADRADAMTRIAMHFRGSPLIKAATPNIMLDSQGLDAGPGAPVTAGADDDGRRPERDRSVEWGLRDIEARDLWPLPGARDGVVFGVLDQGFSRHESLVFIDLPGATPRSDHGNHVAGIACGRPPRNVAPPGVLPNCFVRPWVSQALFPTAVPSAYARQAMKFSDILRSLDAAIRARDGTKAYSVSLVYNWKDFGLPDSDPRVRFLVEQQGSFAASFLQALKEQNKLMFSAAGNDSAALPQPASARFASPFNWAALTARARGIRNGIVVEAHGPDGKRAAFSNVGGDLSCPGVDIVSSVAFDPASGTPSETAYARQSGTSMATPYCAAGLVLLQMVMPGKSPEEIIDCALAGAEPGQNGGAPRLRLKRTFDRCRP